MAKNLWKKGQSGNPSGKPKLAPGTVLSKELRKQLGDLADIEYRTRRLVESMALALQGALLVRYSDPAVADAFCASRLGGDHGGAFGTLPAGVDTEAVLARARYV